MGRGKLRAVVERQALHPARGAPAARPAGFLEQRDAHARPSQRGRTGKTGDPGADHRDAANAAAHAATRASTTPVAMICTTLSTTDVRWGASKRPLSVVSQSEINFIHARSVSLGGEGPAC
jgi:hypothetical protein